MTLKTYGWVIGPVENWIIQGKDHMWFYLNTPISPGGEQMQKIRCHTNRFEMANDLTENRMVTLEGDCVVGVETSEDGIPVAMLSVYCNTLKIIN